MLESEVKIDTKEIEKFLDLKFDKLLVHKIMNKKYFYDNPSKAEKIKRLKALNISIDQYDRWIRDSRIKDERGTLPHNKKTLYNLAGVMDIDPFLLYKFEYHKFQDLLYSLDNAFIIKMLNWNNIHKSLLFMIDFFSPSKEFPKTSIYQDWANSIKNNTKGWNSIFLSIDKTEVKNINDKTHIINIFMAPNIERQVFHIACKKIKPIKSFEFWQQYKIIMIRPLEDFTFYPDCNFKKDIFKNRNMDIKVALFFNISGSFKYCVFEQNKPIKVKFKFKDSFEIYKLSSLHSFNTGLLQNNFCSEFGGEQIE